MGVKMIVRGVFLLMALFACQVNGESTANVKTIKVAENVYMLQGKGGNVGLSIGDDGVFMIDDQYAPMSEKLLKAISELTDKPLKFIVNTHWHRDHTGGNENMGNAGAVIVAHENVRERMLKGAEVKALNIVVPPAPQAALPVVTFSQSVSFHWNKDVLDVYHIGPAHTDGDSIVFFKQANVVHVGDLYFNGLYPFIDTQSGGSVVGMIEEVRAVLARIDSNTQVIPGHGPLSNKRELKAYHHMLSTVYNRVKLLKNKGKSLSEVVASKPTAEFDSQWGKGFLPPDKWVSMIYSAL